MEYDLKSTYLFSELDDAQLAQVHELSHQLTLKSGEPLFESGDPAERFFLVTAGQIKLYRLSMEGNEKIIDIIHPGNTFAEALMFLDHSTYPVSASAISKVKVISFDTARFRQLLRASVDTCFRVMGVMSQRLRGLIKEIDDLTLQTATCRVAGMLVSGLERSKTNEFVLGAPKGVLASLLSVKPETFSRILHNLAEQRVITVRGGRITIHDTPKLRDLAHWESLVGLEDHPFPHSHCPLDKLTPKD